MESAAMLRSFHYSVGSVSHLRSAIERPVMAPMNNVTFPVSNKSHIQGFATKRAGSIASCAKTSDTSVIAKSDESVEKFTGAATFPDGLEGLVLQVCDETQIAELKVKVGGFQMHLKRNIAIAEAPMPVASALAPVSSEPSTQSAPSAPSAPPKSASEKSNPFANVAVEKSRKLAALEASGASGYVLVASPTVGSFRKGRTIKGKKQPPICKEGDVIKEGQTICYVDQFGTELPVKSDAAGEVIKILFDDGEAVGYGDPLIAVSPSFHDINLK